MKRSRLGLIGFASFALVAVLALGAGNFSLSSRLGFQSRAVYAQAPSTETPAPSPAPAIGESPVPIEASPPVSPAPANPADTSPEVPTADTPASSPPAGAPSPVASPSPVETLPQPPVVSPVEVATLPMVGTFEDPRERFQVGILEGYKVGSTAGSPLFEAQDGSMAYSVIVVPPISTGAGVPLSDEGLLQVAQDVFRRGEGFQTAGFSPHPQGGITISWLGSLTIGGKPQPMQGNIVARQSEGSVFLLTIAATEPAAGDLPAATATLSESLQL